MKLDEIISDAVRYPFLSIKNVIIFDILYYLLDCLLVLLLFSLMATYSEC